MQCWQALDTARYQPHRVPLGLAWPATGPLKNTSTTRGCPNRDPASSIARCGILIRLSRRPVHGMTAAVRTLHKNSRARLAGSVGGQANSICGSGRARVRHVHALPCGHMAKREVVHASTCSSLRIPCGACVCASQPAICPLARQAPPPRKPTNQMWCKRPT